MTLKLYVFTIYLTLKYISQFLFKFFKLNLELKKVLNVCQFFKVFHFIQSRL